MSKITKKRIVVAVLGVFFVVILITNIEHFMTTDNDHLRRNFHFDEDEETNDDSMFNNTTFSTFR
jgi:hypothetical protein